MDTTTTPITEGSRVEYRGWDGAGTVLRVIPTTTYLYEVEWDNSDPKTDLYESGQLINLDD